MNDVRVRLHAKLHFYGGLIILVLSLAVMLLLAFQPPGTSVLGRLYPGCMLHRMTGLYCGGCGGTRSVAALARGQLHQALAYNAVVVCLLLPLFAVWLLHTLVYGLCGRRLVAWTRIPLWIYIGIVILFLAFTVARNLPVAPLDALAPHALSG